MVFEPNGGPRKPISSSAVASAIGMRHGGQLRTKSVGSKPSRRPYSIESHLPPRRQTLAVGGYHGRLLVN